MPWGLYGLQITQLSIITTQLGPSMQSICVTNSPLNSCSRIPALIHWNQDGGSAFNTFLGSSVSPEPRALLSGGIPGMAPPGQAGLSPTLHSL